MNTPVKVFPLPDGGFDHEVENLPLKGSPTKQS